MLCRLIAIFALHFFLSVSAFSFGELADAQSVHAESAAVSHTMPEGQQSSVLQDMTPAASALNHSLVGEAPDLPDSLPGIASAPRPLVDEAEVFGYREQAALAPSLDALLRPPQQAALAA